MKHDRRPELPLFTVRAVVRLDITEDKDSRHFWTHEESIQKRRHKCCVKWSPGKRGWYPVADACEAGTHDYLICTAFVIYAHTAQPWKKAPKNINSKNRPDVKIFLAAGGELARQLYVASETDKFLIEGHVTTYYNLGRFWQRVNVFSIKKVTDEQIKSQLSVIAFDRFRTVVRQMAEPLPQMPQLESTGLAEIRERRLAKKRGEVQ